MEEGRINRLSNGRGLSEMVSMEEKETKESRRERQRERRRGWDFKGGREELERREC